MNKRFAEKTEGVITTTDFHSKGNRIAYWIMFGLLVVLFLICVFPVAWVVMSAFKDRAEFYSVPATIIPHSFNPKKIVEVFKQLNFGRYYLNTIVLAFGTLLFTIVSNGLGGFVLSRVRPKGYKFVFTLIFWTMLMPTSINLIPLYMSFAKLPIFNISMLNTYFPMWFIAGANCFDILLFRSFFNSLPKEYDEAAAIDGCGRLRTLFLIILPLCTPIIITVSIFAINGALGDFFWPYLVIKKKELYPFAVQLYQLNQAGYEEDKYMVALFLAMIPSLLIFGIFSKKIMGGMNIGGVKG